MNLFKNLLNRVMFKKIRFLKKLKLPIKKQITQQLNWVKKFQLKNRKGQNMKENRNL